MSRQTANDTFSLEIPDSFELLSGEDLGQLSNSGKDPYQWGVRQAVTNYLIKDGKTVYVFMWAGREENTAADHELFAGIMKSLRRV